MNSGFRVTYYLLLRTALSGPNNGVLLDFGRATSPSKRRRFSPLELSQPAASPAEGGGPWGRSSNLAGPSPKGRFRYHDQWGFTAPAFSSHFLTHRPQDPHPRGDRAPGQPHLPGWSHQQHGRTRPRTLTGCVFLRNMVSQGVDESPGPRGPDRRRRLLTGPLGNLPIQDRPGNHPLKSAITSLWEHQRATWSTGQQRPDRRSRAGWFAPAGTSTSKPLPTPDT